MQGLQTTEHSVTIPTLEICSLGFRKFSSRTRKPTGSAADRESRTLRK